MERFHAFLNLPQRVLPLAQLFVFFAIISCTPPGDKPAEEISFSISSISPAQGLISGGTSITIRGENLKYVQDITIDGTDCINPSIGDVITCTTPSHAAGSVSVVVSSPNDGSASGTFSYIHPELTLTTFSPAASPVAGGTLITFTGTGFNTGMTVAFDGTPCTGLSVLTSTMARCTTPPLSAGNYDVTITDEDDSVTSIRQLTVAAPPVVTSISPAVGGTLGGTVLTITGTDFNRPTVSIGGTLCTVTARSSTSVTCTTNARTAGTTFVRVQNIDGIGVTTNSAFTYIANPRPLSVSPLHGVPGGGTTITITGSNFKSGATVSIEGTACTPVTFDSATQLRCVTGAKAVGTYDLTVTNPDTITGTLADGFEYRELPPTLTAVAPTSGFQIGGQTITLTGTEFRSGATVTVDGQPCTSPTVLSLTSMTCVTPAGATEGAKDVTVTNSDGQSATLDDSFTYYAAPVVASVSPVGGPLAGGTLITVSGTSLRAGAGVSVGGNPCAPVTVNAAGTSLTCTVAGHAAGAVDITVTNSDTQSGTGTGLYTYADAPTVTSVSPNAGRAAGGASVTITGTGFVSGATVSFDTSACTMVSVDSPTSITCRTPSHAVGAVNVSVSNPDTQTGTLNNGYTYQLPPTVTAVSPSGGASTGGTSITITGTNFIAGATVLVGTGTCAVTAESATSITCTTSGHAAGTVNVRVTNPDTQSALITNAFTYLDAPTVTSVSPNSGALAGGTNVTVRGTNFLTGATVNFDTSSCGGVTVVNSTTLTCTTTAHAAGSVNVSVTIDTQTGTMANAYTYSPAPAVTAVSPVAGALAGGTSVTITGTNFVSGATVDFGGSACAVTASTATSITCTTSAHAAGAVTVTVTNPDTQSGNMNNAYTYQAAPVVTAVSPGAITALGGTTMTITGTDFDATPTVSFGGTDCPVSASTATSITCLSPVHASGVVDVVVENSDGQTGTLTNSLIYLDAPTVATVSPAAGALAGGTTLTVTGANFYTGASVDVGGSACTILSLSATTITCTTTANVAGTYAVTVTNVDSQTGNLAAAFTYQPAPVVTSVAFNAGAVGGGTSVIVNGSNFLTGAAVLFDTSSCVVTAVTATTITCLTPAHAAGTVNVRVTNTDGQTHVLNNAYTYQVAPTVASVSPAVGPVAGGTSVTISGTGFLASPSVSIGSVNCAVTAQTSTSITCTTGARVSGVVDVQVTNADSQSGVRSNAFTYLDAPTVASITAIAGRLAGGNTVTITGTNFYANPTVAIGGSACTVQSVSSTSITCRTTARAAGLVDVVVTNVDGQSATLTNGFTYRGAPTVSTVSPTIGKIGGGDVLTITGTGFVAGATVTVGASSCTVDAMTLTSTNINCTTTLSLISGAVSVTVQNPDDLQTGTKTNAFIYLNPPTVTAVSPDGGALAGGTAITVTGTGFYPGATVTVGGNACNSVSVVSNTSLTCTTSGPGAGTVDVVVTNPDTQAGTGTNLFTYRAAPTVTNVNPAEGALAGGTGVTITGTGFVNGATVTFDGSACTSVIVLSSTSIMCVTPPGLPGTADIVVTNNDGQSGTDLAAFTYQAAPTITSVSPSGGPLAGGASIVITGTNINAAATVTIGGTSCPVTATTLPTSVTCTTPAKAAGSYTVTLTNTDGQSASRTNGYTYQGAPTVTGVSPAIGASAGGTVVTISGTNFLTGATVDIGGSACNSVTVLSATSLRCTTTVHAAGTGTITVTNADGQSGSGSSYLYQDAPTVASVSPATSALAGGQAVTITGTGFLTGATVAIGGTSCGSLTVVNATTITCTTGSKTSGGTFDLVVTNTDTQTGTLSAGFVYQAAPTITTISPALGDVAGGGVVTITGTGYLAGALVTINGTTCDVSAVTSTSITCMTRATLAGTYNMVVTNTDGQSVTRTSAFTFVNAPTVTLVNPATGDIAGGTSVTITGTNFFAGSTVDVGGSACTSVNVTNSTTLTCVTPAHAAGAVTVSVISPVGTTGTLANGFTYTSTPATIGFVTGTSSPTPPNPDNYGSTTTNITHTFTLRNSGASATSADLNVTVTGTDSALFVEGTDTCSGFALGAGATCTVQVTFLGAFAGSGSFTATLNATATSGGTATNTLLGSKP